MLTGKALHSGNFYRWRQHEYTWKGISNFLNLIKVKKKIAWNIFCVQFFNWATNMDRLSPGAHSEQPVWTKCVVLCQSKQFLTWVLEESKQFRQNNLLSLLALIEKIYSRLVSVRQFDFDCRSHCGRSHSRQGQARVYIKEILVTREIFQGITRQSVT